MQEDLGIQVLRPHLGMGFLGHRQMGVDIAVGVALAAHVDPAAQAEGLLDGLAGGTGGDLRGQGPGLESPADLKLDSAIRQRQGERAVHVAPAFAQVLHVLVLALDLQELAVGDS